MILSGNQLTLTQYRYTHTFIIVTHVTHACLTSLLFQANGQADGLLHCPRSISLKKNQIRYIDLELNKEASSTE